MNLMRAIHPSTRQIFPHRCASDSRAEGSRRDLGNGSPNAGIAAGSKSTQAEAKAPGKDRGSKFTVESSKVQSLLFKNPPKPRPKYAASGGELPGRHANFPGA